MISAIARFSIVLLIAYAIIFSGSTCISTSIPWKHVYGGNIQSLIDNPMSQGLYLHSGVYDGPINFTGVRDFVIKSYRGKVTIECNEEEYGVLIRGSSNITLEGISINNSKNGIRITGSSNCKIVDNYINFVNTSGIVIYSASGNIVSGNSISGNHNGNYERIGIKVYRSSGNTIVGNTIVVNENDFLIDMQSSYNNNLTLTQCGTFIDNGILCACANGCYDCQPDTALQNNWSLSPQFCPE